jgi:hypothetical protein
MLLSFYLFQGLLFVMGFNHALDGAKGFGVGFRRGVEKKMG